MTEIHPLLASELRRLALDPERPPDEAAWRSLLTRLDAAYRGAEDDRSTLERSSQAMAAAYGLLERSSARALAEERQQRSRSGAILGAALDTMDDGLLVVSRDAEVLLYNRRFVDLWGVPAELAHTGPNAALVAWCLARVSDPEVVQGAIADIVRAGATVSDRHLHLRDGRVFRVYTAPIATTTDEVGRMWIYRDETERLRAETETREAQRFLDSIVENLPDMVWVKDAETLAFVAMNRAGEELVGVERGALIGRDERALRSPEDAAVATDRDRKILERGALFEADEPFETPRGEQRLLHTKKIPIVREDGRPKLLLAIARDITDRRRARTELQAAKDAAERANRTKSEFLSNMSHELRTPLNAILGFAEMLGHDALGDLNDRQRVCVEDIRRAGARMARLVDDLLDLRRIEDQTTRSELGYHALGPLIAEVTPLLEPLAAARGHTLALASGAALPHVQCSPRALVQVLLNLVSNAIKYTPPGGRVALTAERVGPELVELAVVDHGVGIAPQDLPHLFTFFARSGAKREHHMHGSGVGLALTSALVAQMGGTITVESALGRGATFRVRLRSRAELPAALEPARDPSRAPHGAAWIYLASPGDGALDATLAGWRDPSADVGVVALVAEAELASVPLLQARARAHGLPLVGCVFPELVVDGAFERRGALLLRLDPMPPWVLVDGLGASPRHDDAAVEALVGLVDRPERVPGRDTLCLFVDTQVLHIGALIDRVYGRVGDLVHYAGASGGSATFQPLPCVFDGERLVDRAVLGLALPDNRGAALDHGYLVPSSQVVATSARGNRIARIDWGPAFEGYRSLVRASHGVDIDRDHFHELATRFPFAMVRADGETIVRVPVAMGEAGELYCVGEVPDGAVLTVARAPGQGHLGSVEHLVAALAGVSAIYFYCEGRRTHFGRDGAQAELAALRARGVSPIIGAVSLGEIGEARQSGYPLFHNATVAALPWALGGASS